MSRGAITELQGSTSAVWVSGLVKRYPKSPVNAVDGISFAVASGEVFGLLGPNGMVGGVDVVFDPVRARGALAVVPQRSNLDRSISIRRNLTFHAAYRGVSATDAEQRADEWRSSWAACSALASGW